LDGVASAYDLADRETVLFGGCGSVFLFCAGYNETWTWDGTTWTQRT
jgi:hypothetical protein